MNTNLRLKKIEERIFLKRHEFLILFTNQKGISTDSKGNTYSDEEIQSKKKELESDLNTVLHIINFICK